jgi:hypothetical protein
MSAEISRTNGRSLKQQAGDWLFQQGVSTVLLFGILVGAWYGVPAAVREVRDTMKAETASHKGEVKELSETFKWALDRVAPPTTPRQLQPGGGD